MCVCVLSASGAMPFLICPCAQEAVQLCGRSNWLWNQRQESSSFSKEVSGDRLVTCFTTPPFPYVGNKDNNLIFMGFLWELYEKNYTSDWNSAYHMVKCLIKCYLVFNGRPYFSAFHALCPKWWFLNEDTNKPFYKTNYKYLVGMLMS